MMSSYGDMTASSVGIIMKELVRRAITVIRRQQLFFEAEEKNSTYKDDEDFVTSADYEAQQLYLKSLQECFPTFGIIGEENELSIVCQEADTDIYFVVDPLDGTKAFIRRQSHGVGTMLALIKDGSVISSWVGDVMTQEIYGYRPESDKVHRIHDYDTAEQLSVSRRNLGREYVQLFRSPLRYSEPTQVLLRPQTGLFKDIEISGGSLGIGLARLWKSEVAAAILPPYPETPWDMSPVIGISLQLGFVFMVYSRKSKRWEAYEPLIPKVIMPRVNDLLIIHSSNVEQLREWEAKNGAL